MDGFNGVFMKNSYKMWKLEISKILLKLFPAQEFSKSTCYLSNSWIDNNAYKILYN